MITRADTKGIHKRWIEDEKRAKKKDLIHKVVIAALAFIGIIGIVTFTPNPFAFEERQSIDVSLDYQANEQHTHERSTLMEEAKERKLMKQAYEIGATGMNAMEWSKFRKVYEGKDELKMKLKTEAQMGVAMYHGMSYGAGRKDEAVDFSFGKGTTTGARFWTEKEDQKMRERLEKEYQKGVRVKEKTENLINRAFLLGIEFGKDGEDHFVKSLMTDVNSLMKKIGNWEEEVKTRYQKGVEAHAKMLSTMQQLCQNHDTKEGIGRMIFEEGEKSGYWTSKEDETWLRMKVKLNADYLQLKC